MDIGILNSAGQPVPTPLPRQWLGRFDVPSAVPTWASFPALTNTQISNLLAQIAYDASQWDYTLVGSNNELGRYQFTTQELEDYGLILPGSNTEYGTECVNYRHCWTPVTIRNSINSYANYIYNSANMGDFLNTRPAQEHLAYQKISDLYYELARINAIQVTDSAEIIAGMLYVAWAIDSGTTPTGGSNIGTGAYAWRYSGAGTASQYYNAGRYAITVLSQ